MLAAEAGGPELEYRAPYEKQAVLVLQNGGRQIHED